MLDKWKECTRCELHETRRNVVLGRGPMPADILMVGEAPGKVEDLQATPFVGPSGRLLDYMVSRAAEEAEVPAPSIYITNACACRPTDSLSGPNKPPSEEQLWACFERLLDEAKAVNPVRVILVGKIAQKVCAKAFKGAHNLYHPAFILRSGGAKSPYFLKQVRELGDIFKEVYNAKKEEGIGKRVRRPKRRRH